jgi:predicted RNase H-like HicB family nuclease
MLVRSTMTAKPERKTFELPLVSVIRYSREEDGFVAHALDFDLVAVGETEDEATEKIRWAIKAYIEFGLKNYWEDHVIFRAPAEFANELSPENGTLKIMEPIVVQDRTINLARATPNHEPRPATAVAQ